MQDISLTLALHLALLLLGVLVLRLFGKRVRAAPLILGIGVVVLYWTLSVGGVTLQSWLVPQLHWNWFGKIFAILTFLGVIALLPQVTRSDVGLTWHQNAGSLRAALIAIALICALDWGQAIIEAQASNLSPERLLFEGLMPGLDEELVFRGVLLTLFVQAFGKGPLLLGASFGIAEVVITLLFGAAHGVHVSHGVPIIDWETFIMTGLIGAGFMWIRQRTGSLVMAVLAHNLVNFGESFL